MADVVIEIKSTISSDSTDSVVVNTLGKMTCDNGIYCLSYEETDQDGDVTDTLIKIDPDTVTIQRKGSMSSCLTVREGERYTSQYEAAYGSFSVGITGKRVRSLLDENGGRVLLEYEVDTNGSFLSNNIIEINVRRNH